MNTQLPSFSEKHVGVFETKAAEYCGLPVKILCPMEHCSLVCYRDSEFIVNTEDLCFQRTRHG
jgi:hypothetical protein